MGSTSIEWTSGPAGEPGYTFNPWLGCAKVHEGCTNCYAERKGEDWEEWEDVLRVRQWPGVTP